MKRSVIRGIEIAGAIASLGALAISGDLRAFLGGDLTVPRWSVVAVLAALLILFQIMVRHRIAIDPRTEIEYRSVIKLIHERTGLCLHSHLRNYEHPGSSRQQQVTAFAGSNDDDYWIVKGAHNFPESFNDGEPVRHGDVIRLEHLVTRRNLHSHVDVPSPVSHQQEVTAFGEDGVGDTNDNWKVDIENGGVWFQGARARLIHQRTGAALHSHAQNLPTCGFNQQEVTGYGGRDHNDWWRAAIFTHARVA